MTVDVDKSLIVHDIDTLEGADFTLRSTLNQLTRQLNASNVNKTTPEELFERMWDTQNLTPGLVAGGEKCTGTLNGFPAECRPGEGSLARDPGRTINSYIPIALVNRFDLRNTVTQNDCGEYRVVYANRNPLVLRVLMIFDAQVPNPTPGVAAGCMPIAKFWRDLSAETSPTLRARALRNFYFNGLPANNVRAVIDSRNYAATTGQIRTNSNLGSSWILKEFKIGVDNEGLSVIKPVSVKSTPVANLFDGTGTDPRATAFQQDFITNVGSLLKDFNSFTLTVANDAHNNGQSHSSVPIDEGAFLRAFTFTSSNTFKQSLANKLEASGSTLTSDQVLNRATAMTCGGCHMPSLFGLTRPGAVGPNQAWPDSSNIGFTHVDEFPINGSFRLSRALTDVFLPARLAIFNEFLTGAGATAAATPSSQSLQPLTAPMAADPAAEEVFSKRGG